MLESALAEGIEGARVLDAFAGSGALGMEMLSRGAGHATFFDADRGASALVKRNLVQGGLRARALCRGVRGRAARRQAGSRAGRAVRPVLIDPPYAWGTRPAIELAASLTERRLLAPGAIILFERTAATPALVLEGFEGLKEKRYGQTCIDVLRYTVRNL